MRFKVQTAGFKTFRGFLILFARFDKLHWVMLRGNSDVTLITICARKAMLTPQLALRRMSSGEGKDGGITFLRLFVWFGLVFVVSLLRASLVERYRRH